MLRAFSRPLSGINPARWGAAVMPGLVLAVAVAALCLVLGAAIPGVSPLLIAIGLGVAARVVRLIPEGLDIGLAFAARWPLRAGVVLMGFQLSFPRIAELGWGVPLLAVAVVGGGIAGTVALGRALGVSRSLTLLIACGFSICGAAAIAGVKDGIREESEGETVAAVGLVVVFGTLMIPLLPAAAAGLGLSAESAGIWAGASIHELAQVVAAGGMIGGGALAVAVAVKLARVLLLAPVAALVMWRATAQPRGSRALPIPGFVLGFLLAAVFGSLIPLPAPLLGAAGSAQTALLTAAMFALGSGVRLSAFRAMGPRPLILASASTVLVAGIGLVGAVLLG